MNQRINAMAFSKIFYYLLPFYLLRKVEQECVSTVHENEILSKIPHTLYSRAEKALTPRSHVWTRSLKQRQFNSNILGPKEVKEQRLSVRKNLNFTKL